MGSVCSHARQAVGLRGDDGCGGLWRARSGRSVLPESALPRVYPVVLERPVVMILWWPAVPARSVKAA